MANLMSSNIASAEVAYFMGYSNLKPEQEQLINGVLSKHNVFGILPTGFGTKSLCYGSLPLYKYMTRYMKRTSLLHI